VFWNKAGEETLSKLDAKSTLVDQLKGGFSWETSPNWQDASTQSECDAFDKVLGSEEELAKVTGSKAHHVRSYLLFDRQLANKNSVSLALRS
jgi:xylulokinase